MHPPRNLELEGSYLEHSNHCFFNNSKYTFRIHKNGLVIASRMIDLFLSLFVNEPYQTTRQFFQRQCIQSSETNMHGQPFFAFIFNFFQIYTCGLLKEFRLKDFHDCFDKTLKRCKWHAFIHSTILIIGIDSLIVCKHV